MVAFPDVQILDVAGPLEVFARASRWLREVGQRRDDAYRVEILGFGGGLFAASCGLRLHADRALREVGRGIDTLLIAGGVGVERHLSHPPLLRFLRRQATQARRLASVCTGAFFLAEASLLAGRRATTHWASCDKLAHQLARRAARARHALHQGRLDLHLGRRDRGDGPRAGARGRGPRARGCAGRRPRSSCF